MKKHKSHWYKCSFLFSPLVYSYPRVRSNLTGKAIKRKWNYYNDQETDYLKIEKIMSISDGDYLGIFLLLFHDQAFFPITDFKTFPLTT